MANILRRRVVQRLPIRGHDHPDHPFPGFYQHKRMLSIFDLHIWVYDGIQPEYIPELQNPDISNGGSMFVAFGIGFFLPVAIFWFLGRQYHNRIPRPFINYYQDKIDGRETETRKFYKRLRDENVLAHSCPIGTSFNYKHSSTDTTYTDFIYRKLKIV